MDNSREFRQRKIIVFLSAVSLVFVFATVYYAMHSSTAIKRERLINEKAVSSLCENLDSISVSLKKSLYCADKKALSKTGNELCRQAAAAKESLSLLSPERELADEIFRFLSQVGNYTIALSQLQGKTDTDGLRELYSYASRLSEGMNEICYDYYNSDVSFADALGNLAKTAAMPDGDFYKRLYDASQTLGDYPTLVYDGPFADNLAQGRSDFLKNKKEITAEEAAERAASVLGVQAAALRREQDISAEPELYCFSKGKTDITVTKKGGYICSVLSDTYAFEETISAAEAVKRGEEYLAGLGYDSMKSTYYSVYDGICTVNYAYEQPDGTICYSDLIKVSVSLASGKAVALDAKPYLLSHKKRETAEKTAGEASAVKRLSAALTLIKGRLAFIPLETGKEALCYELHCKDSEGQQVLVYLDAYTLEQRDLLILLYSDGGILTK